MQCVQWLIVKLRKGPYVAYTWRSKIFITDSLACCFAMEYWLTSGDGVSDVTEPLGQTDVLAYVIVIVS